MLSVRGVDVCFPIPITRGLAVKNLRIHDHKEIHDHTEELSPRSCSLLTSLRAELQSINHILIASFLAQFDIQNCKNCFVVHIST